MERSEHKFVCELMPSVLKKRLRKPEALFERLREGKT
jgi:hypothetical protein